MSDAIVPGLVSAVIPVFNGAAFVAQAIESVLVQDYAPIEVVVVDDGSTDGTLAAVAAASGPRVTCVSEDHAGIAAARNRGVELSQGEYLAFLDADDLWRPAKTRLQVDLIQSGDLDAAWGQVEQFYETDADRRFEVRAADGARFHAGTLLIRRDAFLRVGYFDTRLTIGEFVDWFARAQAAGLRTAAVGEMVLRRRIHGKNSSITASYREEFLRIARDNLIRRRAAGSE